MQLRSHFVPSLIRSVAAWRPALPAHTVLGHQLTNTSRSPTLASSTMFTVLACLFALFAADGFFRTRTLNDDPWTGEERVRKGSRGLGRLRSVLWAGLAIICLFIASQFEW
jgi:hypothetical protein